LLCLAEHVWKVHIPILSRPRNRISQGTGEPTLHRSPAEKDEEYALVNVGSLVLAFHPISPQALGGESGEARSEAGAAGGGSPILGADRKGRSAAESCTSEARKLGETGCGVPKGFRLDRARAKPLRADCFCPDTSANKECRNAVQSRAKGAILCTAASMNRAIFLFFSLGLPLVAALTVAFAKHLLLHAIPKIDPEATKTRTDIYSTRAAYLGFIVGVLMLGVWALGITALGILAGIRLLGW
jgi:hypothetical protein